jgi:hypothetical protein
MIPTDPRLVRFVARRFNQLKGFVRVPFALSMAAAGWTWSGTGNEVETFVGGLIGLLLGATVCLLVAGPSPELGRVETSAGPRLEPSLVGAATVIIMRFQTKFIPAPDIVWLAFGAYFLWLALDGWPWRWYQVIASAAAIYVAFGRAAFAYLTDFAWMAPRIWVFSLAFIATDIADHLLLVRTLRRSNKHLEEPAS